MIELRDPEKLSAVLSSVQEQVKDDPDVTPEEMEILKGAAEVAGRLEAVIVPQAAPLTRISSTAGMRTLFERVLEWKDLITTIARDLVALSNDDAQSRTLLEDLKELIALLASLVGFQLDIFMLADDEHAQQRADLRGKHVEKRSEFAAALEQAGGDESAAMSIVAAAFITELAQRRAQARAQEIAEQKAKAGAAVEEGAEPEESAPTGPDLGADEATEPCTGCDGCDCKGDAADSAPETPEA